MIEEGNNSALDLQCSRSFIICQGCLWLSEDESSVAF